MNEQIAQKLEERLLPLIKRIEQLEQNPPIGTDKIVKRSAEEDDITRQLDALMKLAAQAGSAFSRTVQKKLQSLAVRLAFLPSAPRIEVIQLAQNILALKPVILVTDDTVNERHQPVLTRIVLMEPTKVLRIDYSFPSPLYEDVAPPVVEEGIANTEKSSLLVSLKQEWIHLQKALQGRFVVTFHLPLAQAQLMGTAQRYGLPVPMLVGHSLLDLLLKYGRVKEPAVDELNQEASSLSDLQLCMVLAKEDVEPFTDLSSVPADQRALQMVQALQAIADATFSLQEPLPISSIKPFDDLFVDPFSENEV
jgi:hypothetical protein